MLNYLTDASLRRPNVVTADEYLRRALFPSEIEDIPQLLCIP
jgi:hypothetical protein